MFGALAQLVAHDTGSVGVRGSNPLRSRFKYNFVLLNSEVFIECRRYNKKPL